MPGAPSDFISFGDWLGSNADQERASLSSLTDTAQQGTQNAVGDAYKQGYGSFSSQGTPGAAGGYDGSDLKSYGDYVNSLSDPSGAGLATQANAMQPGGHYSWLDALGMQTAGGDLVQSAKSQYGQELGAANDAYASGASRAAAESPEAQAGYAQARRAAGYGWDTNTAEGESGYQGELAAGKGAQQASLAAGATARLDALRQQFDKDQQNKQGVGNIGALMFNPVSEVNWASSGFKDPTQSAANGGWNPGAQGDLWGGNEMGGFAGSGFGEGGSFGNPGNFNPTGTYEQNDTGFTSWLSDNGYDANGNKKGG